MARTKAVLGAGARVSDYLSASLLARAYPPDLAHQERRAAVAFDGAPRPARLRIVRCGGSGRRWVERQDLTPYLTLWRKRLEVGWEARDKT